VDIERLVVELALSQIRPELIRAHMRFLADDLLEGRGTGALGHRLAALYAATQFEGLGLEPAGDGARSSSRCAWRELSPEKRNARSSCSRMAKPERSPTDRTS